MAKSTKNKLSAENLIRCIYDVFSRITDKTTTIKPKLPLVHYLMSGLALFKLKYPSLLQFDKHRLDPAQSHNLKTLFHIKQVPSDTSLRERLDQLSPKTLRKAFTRLFAEAQRHKTLESYAYLNGRYLVSIDGTGYFSSKTINCDSCCVKNHRDGTQTYYHQMLAAVLVHPEKSQVIPFCPEFIQKQDGAKKNDCERNASKRLLKDLKREHPHLKLLVVEDALASNAPHIELLQQLGYQFILGAKPADHTWLFDWVEASQCHYYEHRDEQGCIHQFKYLNNAPLNES
ncbi:MAG: transposase, partial [Gammaproteobacteria bacterium]|nr:transposase [Gammaproteobacteria bacterium]